jgi:hypothetical protein
MAHTERYKEFSIRAFRSPDGRWRAEIRKADGSDLTIVVPDLGPRPSLTTSPDSLTADDAIKLAKQAIDGGGMR